MEHKLLFIKNEGIIRMTGYDNPIEYPYGYVYCRNNPESIRIGPESRRNQKLFWKVRNLPFNKFLNN